MKKHTILTACLVMLFSLQSLTPSVFGATVGANSDISSPEGWLEIPKVGKSPLKASYIYEYETRALRPGLGVGDPRMQAHWHLAKLALALGDRVEPYIELGSAQILTQEPVGHSATEIISDAFKFENHFAWGIGSKVLLWQHQVFRNQPKKLKFFTDVKYRRTRTNLESFTGQNVILGSDTIKFNEWQVAIGVSQQFEISKHVTATPYFGGKYSDVDLINTGNFTIENGVNLGGKSHYQSRRKFGPFVGIDIGIGKCVTIFAEGRFSDESSVSTGVTVRI